MGVTDSRSRVVIIGGGMIGTSIAWWLSRSPDRIDSVTVIERDPSYANASTTHSNSCIRQQFSNPLNIQISQFGVDFLTNFGRFLADPTIPRIFFHEFGYLYLADTDIGAQVLTDKQAVQAGCGAATELLTPAEMRRRWPFIDTSDITLGSFGPRDEGYFDSGTMFAHLKRAARANGVTERHGTVTQIGTSASRVTDVTLASGETLAADWVVNAAGPRASQIAAMADVELPVEPRKRLTWVFRCASDLGADLPLTIDPSGVHVRQDGAAFMAGAAPDPDIAVEPDDFTVDPDIFEETVWPALVHRVPKFERLKVISAWAGHYAYNTLDQNAIIGPHPELENFVFANGFSGHGLQQAPAVGRAISELVIHGAYQTLDMTPLGYDRIRTRTPFVEANVI